MRRLPEIVHVVYVTSEDKHLELDVYFTCKPLGQHKYFKTSKTSKSACFRVSPDLERSW